ncbi:hypothetical protein [Solimonas sp. K1W22B-7]|uniref:hypothetical protein n=1 Tax=Solimonas sp. K1W22B-7 TaxID=2303331 RepID=UPI0013C4AD2F|nr:hypothetical protein [Solimonas sp. K1W22B-7]
MHPMHHIAPLWIWLPQTPLHGSGIQTDYSQLVLTVPLRMQLKLWKIEFFARSASPNELTTSGQRAHQKCRKEHYQNGDYLKHDDGPVSSRGYVPLKNDFDCVRRREAICRSEMNIHSKVVST